METPLFCSGNSAIHNMLFISSTSTKSIHEATAQSLMG